MHNDRIAGSEKDFEQVWLSREVNLHKEPGFIAFHLLRGPGRERSRSLFLAYRLALVRRFRGLDEIRIFPEVPLRRRNGEEALSRAS